MRPVLEVIAITAGDARGAMEGGADRLEVVSDIASGGLTPSLELVRDLRQECALPRRVMLRGHDGRSTSGSELSRLKGAAHQFVAAGVEGFVLGFLGPEAEIDVAATEDLVEALDGLPWTFHRAIDHALNTDRAWQVVSAFPGLDAVLTAGSARGLGAGMDDMCRRAAADPRVAELVLAGGGWSPEQVPWLARAGERGFHRRSKVRPDGSGKAYLDDALVPCWRLLIEYRVAAALVLSWRLLIDDAVAASL